ncbi:hypothetical protein D9C73_023085 [Collichthys lucidus]|uniref:Uncharacterized protein n=1 Tax=Collichthys lucidus TaxID=240159 RepID=A0A4U5VMY2_COLLU|nr:hypothetical protein D9C73_023085 [Collichthys lucidus]
MAPARRDCSGWEMFLPTGCLLLSVLLFHPALAKVCNDRTKHGQDNSWFARDGENLPIMVLMPMNESALMSSISQGIEPAVQLAIQHIRESRKRGRPSPSPGGAELGGGAAADEALGGCPTVKGRERRLCC